MNQFKAGIWSDHPLLRQLLGMCSTLAVTTSLMNALFMSFGVFFVLVSSTIIVSLIKNIVPQEVRIAVYAVVIATFVTIIDIFFKANFPDASRALGPYVPLIIVNCIILGRCEAFASKNSPIASFVDALAMSIGYAWVLIILGSIRELLGSGAIAGLTIFGKGYDPLVVALLPAGAFIFLGFMVAAMNMIEDKK